MNGRATYALIVGAVLGATAMPALAGMCYEIIDKNDVVIFRGTTTPVDLSRAGAPDREAMRRRGELLVIFEIDTCVVIGRVGATGSRTLTTDEIVAEWKVFEGNKGGWGSYSSRYGGPATPVPTPSQD